MIPRGPCGPVSPFGPCGPCGPAGSCPALKSAANSEWFFTFALVTAFFFSCAVPTEFLPTAKRPAAWPTDVAARTATTSVVVAMIVGVLPFIHDQSHSHGSPRRAERRSVRLPLEDREPPGLGHRVRTRGQVRRRESQGRERPRRVLFLDRRPRGDRRHRHVFRPRRGRARPLPPPGRPPRARPERVRVYDVQGTGEAPRGILVPVPGAA